MTVARDEALGDGEQVCIHVGNLTVAKCPAAVRIQERRGHPPEGGLVGRNDGHACKPQPGRYLDLELAAEA